MPVGVETGRSEKEREGVQPSPVTEGETTAPRMPLEKPLPIPGLSDGICAMRLGPSCIQYQRLEG